MNYLILGDDGILCKANGIAQEYLDQANAGNCYVVRIPDLKQYHDNTWHDIPQIDAFTFNELQCALNVLIEINNHWGSEKGLFMQDLVEKKIREIKNLIA